MPSADRSSSTNPKLYTITSTQRTTQVRGRDQAVQTAKKMSRKSWRPVHVERDDEKIRMSFVRGSLEEYRHDPRSRKRHRS